MDNVPQTRRMACAIIANAMIFHERIAGMHDGIGTLRSVCGPDVPDPQDRTLDAWTAILKINYWPIFAIGKDILEQLPSDIALRVLHCLRSTAGKGQRHRRQQRPRPHRPRLPAADLRPQVPGHLLHSARLRRAAGPLGRGQDGGHRLERPRGIRQAEGGRFRLRYRRPAICRLRADRLPAREHRRRRCSHPPGDDGGGLYGCDVMPSAIHITGSTLAGIQPEVGYGKSRLYTIPYGRQEDGSVKIGSLEFLDSSSVMTTFNTSDPALRTGSVGEETATQVNAEIPDNTFDLVIMNPPFALALTTDRDEDYVKQFRGLATSFETIVQAIIAISEKRTFPVRGPNKLAARPSEPDRLGGRGRYSASNENWQPMHQGSSGKAGASPHAERRVSRSTSSMCVAISRKAPATTGMQALRLLSSPWRITNLGQGEFLLSFCPSSAASGDSWTKMRRLLAYGYESIEVFSLSANGKEHVVLFGYGNGRMPSNRAQKRTKPGYIGPLGYSVYFLASTAFGLCCRGCHFEICAEN